MKGKMLIAILKKGKKLPVEESVDKEETTKSEEPILDSMKSMREMLSNAFDEEESSETPCLYVDGMKLEGKDIVKFVEDNKERLMGDEKEPSDDNY